jgi:glycosyltransferase domain-containing protein
MTLASAAMNQRLTILLPLKGRALFTLRFLFHASKARLPHRFIVADGQVQEELARLLEDSRKLFPALDIEYVRYPDDSSFRQFFTKVVDGLSRVKTPYVMMADNDDFLMPTGLERSLDFLDAHRDYVCAGGGIAGFSVHSRQGGPLAGVVGSINRLAYRYAPHDRSIDLNSPSAIERLAQGLRISWGYYAVYRTPVLLGIWREVLEMNLSDLQLHERFCALRALTQGKAGSDPATIAYIRQYWTSLQSAFTKDWVHHLVRSHFSSDFAEIVRRVSTAAAASDGIAPSIAAEQLRDGMERWYQNFLSRSYGTSAVARRYIRTRAPSFVNWVKMHCRYPAAIERWRLFARLRGSGAPDSYLKSLRAELALTESIITGREFRDFVTPFIGRLVPQESRE